MADIATIAKRFFETCEAGKGWAVCGDYCTPDASFSAQVEPLAEVRTLRDYTEWMKGLLGFMPDGRYQLKSLATDNRQGTGERLRLRRLFGNTYRRGRPPSGHQQKH